MLRNFLHIMLMILAHTLGLYLDRAVRYRELMAFFRKKSGKVVGMVGIALFLVLITVPDALSATGTPVMVASVNAEDEVNDPLEPVNRLMFGFNEVVRENVLGPVAHAYNDHLPATVRLGVGNFLNN